MHTKRKQKLCIIMLIGLLLSSALALVLYALRENISLFYTPSDLSNTIQATQRIRLGGMVEKNSIKREPKTLKVSFKVTDYNRSVMVLYDGILPDLFREGQGIVTSGYWDAQSGYFKAQEVLAKHDANYMPAELKNALANQKQKAST